MDVSRELLFFFSGLGAFNGFILACYFLLFAKPKHISNFFLGAFLFSLSIRIGKSVFFHFNPDLAFIYLQLGLTGCLFIGPFLYFYIKSVCDLDSKISHEWKYHMLFLIPLALIYGYLYPFEDNVRLWRWYVIDTIYYIWFVYSLLAAYLMRSKFKALFSRAKLDSLDIWLLSIWVGNFCIWLAYYFQGYGSYILGALLFSFMLYLLVMLLVFNKKKKSILLTDQVKYKNKIAESIAVDLKDRLKALMEQEKLHKNPNIKLPDVAKKLNVLPHTLSQFLNDNLGKGFPQFLNEYRVEEAKTLLKINTEFTLEAIGYDCGFNSKSTFYSTFKKIVGTTPSKYRDSALSA